MYFNNLKFLRDKFELTQEELANTLDIKRNTYKNWELGLIIIPLEIADRLSLFYNVRLSYIVGIDKKYKNAKTQKINYIQLVKNLNDLKISYNVTYQAIANYIGCAKSTCYDYFNGQVKIPIDRLILISKFFNIDLDKLCGKEE